MEVSAHNTLVMHELLIKSWFSLYLIMNSFILGNVIWNESIAITGYDILYERERGWRQGNMAV